MIANLDRHFSSASQFYSMYFNYCTCLYCLQSDVAIFDSVSLRKRVSNYRIEKSTTRMQLVTCGISASYVPLKTELLRGLSIADVTDVLVCSPVCCFATC